MHKSECGPVSRTGQSYPANKQTSPSKKMNTFYRFALPEAIALQALTGTQLFNRLRQYHNYSSSLVSMKQLLLDTRMQDKVWKQMEKLLGVDRAQVRRAMIQHNTSYWQLPTRGFSVTIYNSRGNQIDIAQIAIYKCFLQIKSKNVVEKASQSFMNGFSGPKSLRDSRETGPSSDNGSVSCDKQWSPNRDDCQARDNLTWHAVSLFGQQREGRLMFQCNKITLEVSSK